MYEKKRGHLPHFSPGGNYRGRQSKHVDTVLHRRFRENGVFFYAVS